MKTLPPALATHMAGGTTTLAHVILITLASGTRYAFTSADTDITLDVSAWEAAATAQLFSAAQGLDATAIVSSVGMNVDNLEMTTLNDGTLFTREDVLAGKWRKARFTIGRYNRASTTSASDIEILMRGTFGDVQIDRTTVNIELRGLTQALQQPVGSVLSATCRARFADGKCRAVAGTYTVTGYLTAVTSTQVIADSARAEAADWFSEGIITFTTGLNAGAPQKVKVHGAGGLLTLALPLIYTPAIGDAYSLIAGCRKRFTEDCVGKFANALNFQGEPHLPGVHQLSQ